MHCELCGKDAQLFIALVEGTQLKVCTQCSTFGKVLRKDALTQIPQAKMAVQRQPASIERIVDDYAKRIKTAREKYGLGQQDFAKMLSIKESFLHKVETGTFEPPLDIARKLEKALHIVLVETREEGTTASLKKERTNDGLTIGDILKVKH
jgi:uncharacterized protein (TIGR00270 family)